MSTSLNETKSKAHNNTAKKRFTIHHLHIVLFYTY